jgi:uncharacterized protein (DUF486 family)
MKTILLLICSNIFMTIAWYGHLKYRKAPLLTVILVSWLIAFAEYCFQVPANRIGYGEFTAFQLKVIQEVITLCVFVIFARSYLGESIKWSHAASFLFLVGAVVEVQPLRTNISAERRQEFATLVDDTVRRIESGRLRTKTTSATSSMRVIQE